MYEGFDANNMPMASEESKLSLKKIMAGMDEIDIEADGGNCLPQESETEDNIDGCLNSWIQNVKQESESKYLIESTGSINERENFHYLPEFSKSFLRLLRTYPLWSSVMIHYFEVKELRASSASVESYFNDLKNRSYYNDKLPIRVDKFVCKHIREIESMFKLMKHDSQNEKETDIQNKTQLQNPKNGTIDEINVLNEESTNFKNNNLFKGDIITQHEQKEPIDQIQITSQDENNLKREYSYKLTNNKKGVNEEDRKEMIDLEVEKPNQIIENWRGLGKPKKKLN